MTKRMLFVGALLGVAFVSLLYVRQTNDLASAGYDVAQLQSQEVDWTMRNQQLQVQLDGLTSLDRVDQVASSRLGMGPPSRVIYVIATPLVLPTVPPALPSPTATPVEASLGSLLRGASGLP